MQVYINSLTFGGSDAVAAALSTNFIHIVDLEAKKSKKTLDFSQNVVGIHFDLSSSPGEHVLAGCLCLFNLRIYYLPRLEELFSILFFSVLRMVDDSFGIHV